MDTMNYRELYSLFLSYQKQYKDELRATESSLTHYRKLRDEQTTEIITIIKHLCSDVHSALKSSVFSEAMYLDLAELLGQPEGAVESKIIELVGLREEKEKNLELLKENLAKSELDYAKLDSFGAANANRKNEIEKQLPLLNKAIESWFNLNVDFTPTNEQAKKAEGAGKIASLFKTRSHKIQKTVTEMMALTSEIEGIPSAPYEDLLAYVKATSDLIVEHNTELDRIEEYKLNLSRLWAQRRSIERNIDKIEDDLHFLTNSHILSTVISNCVHADFENSSPSALRNFIKRVSDEYNANNFYAATMKIEAIDKIMSGIRVQEAAIHKALAELSEPVSKLGKASTRSSYSQVKFNQQAFCRSMDANLKRFHDTNSWSVHNRNQIQSAHYNYSSYTSVDVFLWHMLIDSTFDGENMSSAVLSEFIPSIQQNLGKHESGTIHSEAASDIDGQLGFDNSDIYLPQDFNGAFPELEDIEINLAELNIPEPQDSHSSPSYSSPSYETDDTPQRNHEPSPSPDYSSSDSSTCSD